MCLLEVAIECHLTATPLCEIHVDKQNNRKLFFIQIPNFKFEFLKFIVFYRAKTAVRRSSDGRPQTIRRPSVDRPTRKNSAKNKVCLK